MLTTLLKKLRLWKPAAKTSSQRSRPRHHQERQHPESLPCPNHPEKHFQVVHSRGKVRTPETADEDSVLQDTWVAFLGGNTDKKGPSMASLGKSPDTANTAKETALASIYEILTDEPSETGCFSGAKPHHHKKFSAIPSLLPLPWQWAATIADNPEWTVQTTTRFIIFSCYGWLRSSDRDTVGNIMRFLMGAATGKTATAKKINPKVLLPTKPFTTNEAATEWVEIHQERMWTRLAETPKRATPPRNRNNSSRKQSPLAGANNQTPAYRAQSGDTRLSSHPQRGANKRATRSKTASQAAATPQQATADQTREDTPGEEELEETAPAPAPARQHSHQQHQPSTHHAPPAATASSPPNSSSPCEEILPPSNSSWTKGLPTNANKHINTRSKQHSQP
jgi:hypothetical protein